MLWKCAFLVPYLPLQIQIYIFAFCADCTFLMAPNKIWQITMVWIFQLVRGVDSEVTIVYFWHAGSPVPITGHSRQGMLVLKLGC